jgi:hypothetical protein
MPGWSSAKPNSNHRPRGIPGAQVELTVAGAVAVSDSVGVGVGVVLGVGVGVGDGVVGVGVGDGVVGVGVGVGVWVGDLAGLGLGEAVPDFDGFGPPLVCRDPLGLTVGVTPARAWRSWAPLWRPPCD